MAGALRLVGSGILLLALMAPQPAAVADAAIPEAGGADTKSAVKPIVWERFSRRPNEDSNARLIKRILLNANRYALTSWYHDQKRYAEQTGRYLDFGGRGERAIRPPTSEAFALAVSLSTGAYDPEEVGVSRQEAREVAIRLIASTAYQHKANSAGGWGDAWQSALWAAMAGHGGWLMWDDLSPIDREYVRRMVEHEANRFVDYRVPYYRDADGNVVSPGDSKAEENSWNALILQLSTAMMPHHENWSAWMAKNVELMISAFARPDDINSKRRVNGKPLREWLNGSNVETEIPGPAPLTADSHYDAQVNPVSNLADGDTSTWWASDGSPMPHWVEIEPDDSIEVSEVVVRGRRLGDALIHDLDLDISTAQGDIHRSVRDNEELDIRIPLESAVTADRIRITLHRQTFLGQPRHFADLAEIELYDTAGQRHDLVERIDLGDRFAVVINHRRIHPDYMTTAYNSASAGYTYTLAGMPTPRAALFNVDILYNSLVDLEFPHPPFNPPGGTTYKDGTWDIYYPQSNDWGSGRQMNFVALDVLAHEYGFDADTSVGGDVWAGLHAGRAFEMQERHADGRMYADDAEDSFYSKEEFVAFLAARSYLTKWVSARGYVRFTNRAYPVNAP